MAQTGLKLLCPLEDCDSLVFTAPSPGVSAGDLVFVEDIVVVATHDADTGDDCLGLTRAPKILLPCAAAATAGYAVGERVFFDVADAELNESASSNHLCGVVTKASAVGDEEVQVNFNGLMGVLTT